MIGTVVACGAVAAGFITYILMERRLRKNRITIQKARYICTSANLPDECPECGHKIFNLVISYKEEDGPSVKASCDKCGISIDAEKEGSE